MKPREESIDLMNEYISNDALINHCGMVAKAMEAYANRLKLAAEEIEMWWTAGLLHDLDWEKYPDDHPNIAVNEILPTLGYEEIILEAIKAHAPDRTGKKPEKTIEKYLFACDELSGFLFAAKLIRPNGWDGMEVSSIKKKLKDKRFAANVSRDDIIKGAELIEVPLEDHITFLIEIFSK
jgi:putative nucleotidyltransferase with HDIG domain